MTILYAEDDSMTVMEVQEKLENNGYEVIVVRGVKRNAIN